MAGSIRSLAVPTISDAAVCLRRWDFSETSQTVALLTREHGVIRGLAKGAKRERGSFSGGFDVLTGGHLVAIVKPGRDLATLTEWKLQDVYRGLRHDLAANRAGLYMADLAAHMVTDHDPHPGLFAALVSALRASADDPAQSAAALLGFQWTLLHETGYRPRLTPAEGAIREDEDGAVAFSAVAGGVVAPGVPGAWRVRRATLDLLAQIEGGLDPLATTAVPPDSVDRANRLLASYARALLGDELPTTGWMFGKLA